MKKLIPYFILGMLLVIIGCFIFVTHISSSFGKILLLTGSLVEIYVIYKLITRRKTV